MNREVTKREVAEAIDWLSLNDDELEFDSVNWSQVEESGRVWLQGRKGDSTLVDVVVQIVEVRTQPDYDSLWSDDDEESEAEHG